MKNFGSHLTRVLRRLRQSRIIIRRSAQSFRHLELEEETVTVASRSCRWAAIGSTRMARRAGIQEGKSEERELFAKIIR